MADYRIQGFQPGTIGRVTELHGRYYSSHWGLDTRFEAEVARDMAEFMTRFDPRLDGIWVAVRDGDILGSITIDGTGTEGPDARLRWFIIDEAGHGLGIGKRLMEEAMAHCARAKFESVFLWTFAGLDAARHLYETWGFQLTESFEDKDWGDPVIHQRFDKSMP